MKHNNTVIEHKYTITLGELAKSYRSGWSRFLCATVMDMFYELDTSAVPEDYMVNVIQVFQEEFPEYVSPTMIDPYSSIIDGYIIDPEVRSLCGRELRNHLLTELVNTYGVDHLLTFTIVIGLD